MKIENYPPLVGVDILILKTILKKSVDQIEIK